MKTAISSTGVDLESRVDPRFGRAPYFIFLEDEPGAKLKVYSIENTASEAAAGAGTEAAQQVVREKVDAVVSGAVGPNAFEIFEKLGIDVFPVQGDMTVREAYERLKNGSLKKMSIKRL